MADDCATVFVEHVNLNLTTSGLYCISIVPSQAFQLVLEVLAVKLEEIPLQEQRSIYLKLHRQVTLQRRNGKLCLKMLVYGEMNRQIT